MCGHVSTKCLVTEKTPQRKCAFLVFLCINIFTSMNTVSLPLYTWSEVPVTEHRNMIVYVEYSEYSSPSLLPLLK